MKDEKISIALKKYHEHLEKLEAEMREVDYDARLPYKKITLDHNKKAALDHLLSMIPKMEKFIKEGQREKFFRWLGFMQGVLWSFGEFSLNDLRNHNR